MARLNIGNKIGQFESVPFVNDMTNHQLKVFIKHLWGSMQDIASVCDETNAKGVSRAIDTVLDGGGLSKVELRKSLG